MGEKKSNVIPFPGAAKPAARVHQSIAGSGNVGIVGDGNEVHVTVMPAAAPARESRAPVPPPPDHITDEQAAAIRQLHAQWVELAAAVKTRAKPITPQQAWIAINRKGNSRTYTHMRQVHFEAVCSYIQQQIAILRASKTARKRDPKWRNSRIAAIKARSINQLGDEFVYLPFISRSFNAQSLTELDDEQLEATYRHVLGIKPKHKK